MIGEWVILRASRGCRDRGFESEALMTWPFISKRRGSQKASRTASRGSRARRHILHLEQLEARELPSASSGFLQGTVFNDANKNGQLDGGEGYVPGAAVNLYDSGGNLVAQ